MVRLGVGRQDDRRSTSPRRLSASADPAARPRLRDWTAVPPRATPASVVHQYDFAAPRCRARLAISDSMTLDKLGERERERNWASASASGTHATDPQ